jgi:hypothetical protein
MLTRMEWLRGIAILVGIVIAIWLALVAVIWIHRPSRHLAGAALRLLPDTLHAAPGRPPAGSRWPARALAWGRRRLRADRAAAVAVVGQGAG